MSTTFYRTGRSRHAHGCNGTLVFAADNKVISCRNCSWTTAISLMHNIFPIITFDQTNLICLDPKNYINLHHHNFVFLITKGSPALFHSIQDVTQFAHKIIWIIRAGLPTGSSISRMTPCIIWCQKFRQGRKCRNEA